MANPVMSIDPDGAATSPQAAVPRSPASGWFEPAAILFLQGLWLVVVPVLAAGVVLVRLVPAPNELVGTWIERALAKAVDGSPVAVGVGLFLAFSALVRSNGHRLPGGRVVFAERAASPGAPPRRDWSILPLMALAIVAAGALRFLVVDSYRITSWSMLPALEAGDRIGVLRSAYGLRLPGSAPGVRRTPRRGDVIVFESSAAGEEPGGHVVKRVIGVPGDRVGMQGGHPIINGWTAPHCDAGTYTYLGASYVMAGRLTVEWLGDKTYLTVHTPLTRQFDETYVVKPGELFVLGDNRNNSADSRAWGGGRGAGLPLSAVEGRVEGVLLGTQRNGNVDPRQVLSRLGLTTNLDGVDTRALEEGIERCLKERPGQTEPPP